MKNNSKQWAKGFMAILIGAIPLILAQYTNKTWYYVFMVVCFLFIILGTIAVIQLLLYTIIFPKTRNNFVKTLYGLAILITLSLPYFWIIFNENKKNNLLNNFEITDGIINKTYFNSDSSKMFVQYYYKVNNKYYIKDVEVKKEPQYNNVNVKYLPSNPDINELIIE